MRFTKMQAMGNDFVFFGSPSATILPDCELIKNICDRHYGIGADCAVFIQKSKNADYFMHVYNPNGFEAEMCGNALRCSAEYVKQSGYYSKQSLTVETKSGLRAVKHIGQTITTEIGKAHIIEKSTLQFFGISLPYIYLNIGNPHCVIFVPAINDEEFNHFASMIENSECFPEGTNVEFVIPLKENVFFMRVWERGIGETLSCTTGSCASAAAALNENLCGHNVQIEQKGGTVNVNIRECGNIFVTGECKSVFSGDLFV